MKTSRWILCFVALTTTACGLWNTAKRGFNVNQGTGALIDVKQRAIVVATIPTPNQNGPSIIVCAEPSPDALAAYAADLAAKVTEGDKLSAALGLKTQEQASSIGLRTQSIQLLRDGFYRGCEAYLNGALDAPEYAFLVRRYQKYTVALLAIEQLTGAVQPKGGVILNPTIASATEDPTKKPTEEPTKKDDGSTKDKTPKPTATPQPTTAPAATATSPSTLDAVGKVVATTPTPTPTNKPASKKEDSKKTSTPMPVPPTAKASNADIGVAQVVRDIAMDIIDTDDFAPACFAYLQKAIQRPELTNLCKDSLEKLIAANVAIKMHNAAIASTPLGTPLPDWRIMGLYYNNALDKRAAQPEPADSNSAPVPKP